MSDGSRRPAAGRTTTLTLLTDWPLSKPNRDLNGDQKAAVIGGVRRHVQSSANRKAHWRRVLVPGSIRWLAEADERYAGRFGLSIRTKHVTRKLIAESLLAMPGVAASLARFGIPAERHLDTLAELGKAVFDILQKSGAGKSDRDGAEQEGNGAEGDDAPVLEKDKTAIAAYGKQEMEELRAVLAARVSAAPDWASVMGGKPVKGGKKAKGGQEQSADGAQPPLTHLLSHDAKLARLWGLSRLDRLGIDGALFGTMVTKQDYRIASPSAVQVSHSVTVHRAFDFETLEIARDDLEETSSAAILLDASYASGLYVTSVTIDHAQLVENVMAPEVGADGAWHERIRFHPWTKAGEDDLALAGELARAVVVSVLYATDHAMKTQTNARVMPCYVLGETGTKGTLNLSGAFTTPISDRATNGVLANAIQRLRRHAQAFDAAYALTDARAELLVTEDAVTADAPDKWGAVRLPGAEALADWVRDQVRLPRPT